MSEENKITTEYTDDNIRHLSDMEHVRTRPGMYIGRLGDGSMPEDGIYVLLKEVIDNSIDEFKMNAGKRLLDDAVFFRIKEQQLISLRTFHISLLCGCVKDTGENTSLINLPIITFRLCWQ